MKKVVCILVFCCLIGTYVCSVYKSQYADLENNVVFNTQSECDDYYEPINPFDPEEWWPD